MKIYVAHSRSFDFQKELYEPLRNSVLSKEHTFVFPHVDGEQPFKSKDLLKKGCDLVIAEVTFPATGLGIELGWADLLNVPIVCFFKTGSKISGSLKAVADRFIEYSSVEELLTKLTVSIGEVGSAR